MIKSKKSLVGTGCDPRGHPLRSDDDVSWTAPAIRAPISRLGENDAVRAAFDKRYCEDRPCPPRRPPRLRLRSVQGSVVSGQYCRRHLRPGEPVALGSEGNGARAAFSARAVCPGQADPLPRRRDLRCRGRYPPGIAEPWPLGRHRPLRRERCQAWIPAGFAHGFVTLAPNTVVHYKITAPRSAEDERGLSWNDPDIGIDWPMDESEAVLSDRDRVQPRLVDLPPAFLFAPSTESTS